MSDLANAIREIAAVGRSTQAATLPARGQPAGAAPGVPTLAPGVRVLDLVTGKTGVIQRVDTQQLTIPTT